jgi:hypothetical protein
MGNQGKSVEESRLTFTEKGLLMIDPYFQCFRLS